jgi:hypothetical protein
VFGALILETTFPVVLELPVVTANQKHYRRVPDLGVIGY